MAARRLARATAHSNGCIDGAAPCSLVHPRQAPWSEAARPSHRIMQAGTPPSSTQTEKKRARTVSMRAPDGCCLHSTYLGPPRVPPRKRVARITIEARRQRLGGQCWPPLVAEGRRPPVGDAAPRFPSRGCRSPHRRCRRRRRCRHRRCRRAILVGCNGGWRRHHHRRPRRLRRRRRLTRLTRASHRVAARVGAPRLGEERVITAAVTVAAAAAAVDEVASKAARLVPRQRQQRLAVAKRIAGATNTAGAHAGQRPHRRAGPGGGRGDDGAKHRSLRGRGGGGSTTAAAAPAAAAALPPPGRRHGRHRRGQRWPAGGGPANGPRAAGQPQLCR